MKKAMTLHNLLLETSRFPQDRTAAYQMDANPPLSASDALHPALREKAVSFPMNIVIAGGITGGHLFPGVAIAQAFKARHPESNILFISIGNSFERSVIEKSDFQGRWIHIEGIKGRSLWKKLKAICRIPFSVLEAMRLLKDFQPDLVVGMGGYSSGPVVLAARLLGIPIVLHEQNMLPGITNRKLAKFARRVYISFPNTQIKAGKERILLSGNPIRREIIHHQDWMDVDEATARVQDPYFVVFVMGGSQGAHSINMAIIEALGYLDHPEKFYFIHQTGAADENLVKGAYLRHKIAACVQPFFQDVASQYHRADIVICRAGATTVAEITAMGKPALFIPYPYAADNHQVLNARALVNVSAADMLLESGISGRILAERLAAYAGDSARLEEMANRSKALGRPNAAESIVDDCYRFIAEAKA